jgi:hypothetical protein
MFPVSRFFDSPLDAARGLWYAERVPGAQGLALGEKGSVVRQVGESLFADSTADAPP